MNIKITLLLVLALFSVSTSPIIGKYLEDVSAMSISFWRMFFGAAILWTFSLFKSQGEMTEKINLYRTIVAGIFLGLHFVLFFTAIKLTFISNATFLGTLAPLFTLLIEVLIFKRKYKLKTILGLLITLFGAFIILFTEFDLSENYTIGNYCAILCSLVIAISFLIGEKVRKSENTIVYTRTLYLSASVTLFVLSFLFNESLTSIALSDFYGLVFLGLVPTIIGHNSLYYAIKYVSPTIVATFPIGEPVLATILAYFIFGEIISSYIFLGGIFTITGLIFISSKK